jgi:hypothetical protein
MATQEIAIVQAQFSALDPVTAQRVSRLVEESRSSPELALLAVQEADRERAQARMKTRRIRQSLTRFLAYIGAR